MHAGKTKVGATRLVVTYNHKSTFLRFLPSRAAKLESNAINRHPLQVHHILYANCPLPGAEASKPSGSSSRHSGFIVNYEVSELRKMVRAWTRLTRDRPRKVQAHKAA